MPSTDAGEAKPGPTDLPEIAENNAEKSDRTGELNPEPVKIAELERRWCRAAWFAAAAGGRDRDDTTGKCRDRPRKR